MKSLTPPLLLALLAAASVCLAAPTFNPDVGTPMTAVIHHSMEQRYSRLVKFYAPDVIGLANDGMVTLIGEPGRLKIGTRQIVEKLIDAENADRLAFLASVAQANGRGSDLTEARAAWLLRWQAQLPQDSMWQTPDGQWLRKAGAAR